ncbi:MAG: hypothetical protein RIT27_1196 [Pseudomonadota bacterium]|jgi:surface polysaccharide O-acyltransferase-like enzyme
MEQRRLYLDLLRVISVFAVIVIHVSAPVLHNFTKIPADHWMIGNVLDSMSRFCVPMLFMISGALVLGDSRNYQISYLFRKRILRILIPFVVWSLIYALFILQLQGKAHEFKLMSTLQSIVTTPAHYHLWFLYTLLGVYLIIPLLGTFAINANQSTIHYFLVLWCLFAICNPFLVTLTTYKLPLFSLPSNFEEVWLFCGYFLLGFYLSRVELNYKVWHTLALIIVSFILTMWLTHYFSYKNNKFYELFYAYTSPNVLIMSVGTFLLVKKMNFQSHFVKRFSKIIITLSQLSFGIYLVHLISYNQINKYLHLDNTTLNGNPIHPAMGILLTSVCVFVISAILTYLIRQIPLIGKRIT